MKPGSAVVGALVLFLIALFPGFAAYDGDYTRPITWSFLFHLTSCLFLLFAMVRTTSVGLRVGCLLAMVLNACFMLILLDRLST